MSRIAWLAPLFASACFHPTYHDPTCGPNGECPSGLACIAGTCRAPDAALDDATPSDVADPDAIDAPIDAPVDAGPLCLGPTSWQLCVTGAAPTTPLVLPSTINTDTSSECATNIAWTNAAQPASCVIAASTITISGTSSITGSKPLVLFATNSIAVTGTLDVSSRVVAGTIGAGAQPSACGAFPQAPATSIDGGGGGAGGSHGTAGGGGGAGGNGAQGGGAVITIANVGSVLRGGCGGQAGADGKSPGVAGTGSPGGGAVYLVAATGITLQGTINASGAGGGRGDNAGGGGGAGAGGMIVLYAPQITATASGRVVANGGGGGGGGGGSNGNPGADPSTVSATTPAIGGTSGAGNGCGGGLNGRGGSGFAGTTAATTGAAGATLNQCGGGGGGGGGGYIRANQAIANAVASPAITVVP